MCTWKPSARRPRGPLALTALALMLLGAAGLGGCAATGEPGGAKSEVVVFAAASLQKPFEERIGPAFEQGNPGVRVKFSFGGSASLVSQIEAGAPAQVLACADEPNMDRAQRAGLVRNPARIIATNTLALAVQPGNPRGVTGLNSSLAGAKTVSCAPGVPCGNATASLSALNGYRPVVASEENSVTGVLGKVTSGQADAGIVYRTDAAAAGKKVEVIEIAHADDVVNKYPIAAVGEAGPVAQKFIDYVAGPGGQGALAEAGFGPGQP